MLCTNLRLTAVAQVQSCRVCTASAQFYGLAGNMLRSSENLPKMMRGLALLASICTQYSQKLGRLWEQPCLPLGELEMVV